jgi:hypothetical protein
MVSINPWTHFELQRAWYLHSICQTPPSPHSCHQYASYNDPFLSSEYCISSIVLSTTNLFYKHIDLHTLHCVSSHCIWWLIHSMSVSSSMHTLVPTSFINVYFPLTLLVHENSHKIILTNTPHQIPISWITTPLGQIAHQGKKMVVGMND